MGPSGAGRPGPRDRFTLGWFAVGLTATRSKPFPHFGDLALLFPDHIRRPLLGLLVLAVLQDNLCHVDGALLVRDHAFDKGDVRIGVLVALRHRAVHFVHGGHVSLGRLGLRAGLPRLAALAVPALHHGHAALRYVLHHRPALLRHVLHHLPHHWYLTLGLRGRGGLRLGLGRGSCRPARMVLLVVGLGERRGANSN